MLRFFHKRHHCYDEYYGGSGSDLVVKDMGFKTKQLDSNPGSQMFGPTWDKPLALSSSQ